MTDPNTKSDIRCNTGLLIALVVLLFCCALSAQVPTAAAKPAGTVHASNLTDHARRDVITTVVPFADAAEYRGGPIRIAGGAQCTVSPFGATWPDGSWRQARVVLPLELQAREGRAVPLTFDAGGSAPPFRVSEAVRRGIGDLVVALAVGDRAQDVLVFGPWVPIEDTHLTKAWAAVGRVPNTPVWAWFAMELGSGGEHLRWWLHYGTSDPRDPAVAWELPRIRLVVVKAAVGVHHQPHRVLASSVENGATLLTLNRAASWGEGEAQARTGILAFLPGAQDLETLRAEATLPTLAVADWTGSDAWGPWGVLPQLPAGWDRAQAEQLAAREYNSFEGGPWEPPVHGLLRDPSSPGDQLDFSAWVMTAEAQGWPQRLYAIHRSVQQEACRPGWYADPAGDLVKLGALRNVHIWAGQVHHTSPNTLGKPFGVRFRNPHGFKEKDRQHWSTNYLSAYALATADRLAVRFAHHQVEQWMAQYPAHSTGHGTIDGMDAARAIGRMFLGAAGLELVTGRRDLAQVVEARVARAGQTWVGRNTAPHRPIVIDGPTGKQLATKMPNGQTVGQHWFTMPWQRGYAALGADGWAQVWGSSAAADLAALWAISTVEHGVFWKGAFWDSAKSVSWDWSHAGRFDAWREWQANQPHPPIQPPGAWNYVEFADLYMSRMAPAMIIAQREGYDAKDTAAMLRQVGTNDFRTREWRAVQ